MADISGISGTALDFYTKAVNQVKNSSDSSTVSNNSFDNLLNSAMDMVKETDTLAADAEQSAIDFSLGKSENTHELRVAQQKAYLSLQYTVAVKNAVLDAYKEIMNIQL